MSGAAPSGLLVATHDLCWLHDPGPGHPEGPDRLTAVRSGIHKAGLGEAITWIEAPEAEAADVAAVHPPDMLESLDRLCQQGGGAIDADTFASADSGLAARRAAGAGLDLIRRLEAGEGAAGWSMVRPPGHHAMTNTQMGFCLVNNVAVAAKHLIDRGERVAIVDVDAHHGNGTQDIFYDEPNVLFISFHQFPLYPGTGRPDEIGTDRAAHTTVNIALPAHTPSRAYRAGVADVVAPVMADFEPTWLLVSLGFDAHRADPITELSLTATDFADIVDDLCAFAPPGRRLFFLEGGYDLEALAASSAAVAAVLVGESHRPEESSEGEEGAAAVDLAQRIHVAGRLR